MDYSRSFISIIVGWLCTVAKSSKRNEGVSVGRYNLDISSSRHLSCRPLTVYSAKPRRLDLGSSKEKQRPCRYPSPRRPGSHTIPPRPEPGKRPPRQPRTAPIAHFASLPPTHLSGSLLDVNASYICYAVKSGLVRVIDRRSALRTLLRGHTRRVDDVAFFGNVAGGTNDEDGEAASGGGGGRPRSRRAPAPPTPEGAARTSWGLWGGRGTRRTSWSGASSSARASWCPRSCWRCDSAPPPAWSGTRSTRTRSF